MRSRTRTSGIVQEAYLIDDVPFEYVACWSGCNCLNWVEITECAGKAWRFRARAVACHGSALCFQQRLVFEPMHARSFSFCVFLDVMLTFENISLHSFLFELAEDVAPALPSTLAAMLALLQSHCGVQAAIASHCTHD